MEKIKKVLIGIIIFVMVIVTLKTVLQVMSPTGGPSTIADETQFGNQSVGMADTSMSWGVPSIGSSRSKSVISNNAMTEATWPVAISADKKVIKNGNLSLKVNSVDNAAQDIITVAKANGGDIFSSNIYNRNNIKSGNIVIKVPVTNFEKTFSEIKKVSSLVVQESTTGQDVTEEYADLQAQLKNRQAEEAQFQSILQQAQKIQDVLDVTQQLYRVRGEIEQLQGRMKYMESQTDMSSITVSLSEDQNITVADSWRPWQVIKEAFNALFKDIQGFVDFVIVLIIRVIPNIILYTLILGLLFWIGKKIYFRIKS